MNRIGVRISRCSLGLSLIAGLGLLAWIGAAAVGGATGSQPSALTGLVDAREASVEVAQAQPSKRRTRASRSRRQRSEDDDVPSRGKTAEPEPNDKNSKGKPATGEHEPDTSKDNAPPGKATEKDAAGTGKEGAPDGEPPADQAESTEPTVWSQEEIITALEECVRLLAPIAAHVEVSSPVRSGQCGAPAVVALRRVGGETPVEISPPAVVNCRMVSQLHEWVEEVLQPAAREMLKAPVTRMVNASGYVCRNRYGAKEGKISEHAFANALDISAFVTADGRKVDVLKHWGHTQRDLRAIAEAKAEAERQAKAEAAAAKAAEKAKETEKEKDENDRGKDKGKSSGKEKSGTSKEKNKGSAKEKDEPPEVPPPARNERRRGQRVAAAGRSSLGGHEPAEEAGEVSVEGAFLRRLHKGACGPFTTVLGPEANEAHRNHFHFDLAERRRRRAFCE